MTRNDLRVPSPALPPLTRAKVRGWVSWVFWGLRVYIAAMLVLVAIGFSRGLQ